MGQYGVIFGEHVLGYLPKGTQHFLLIFSSKNRPHMNFISNPLDLGLDAAWTQKNVDAP